MAKKLMIKLFDTFPWNGAKPAKKINSRIYVDMREFIFVE